MSKQEKPLAKLLSLIAGALVVLAGTRPADAAADSAQIARGQYLARTGDCVACHSKPGGEPYAGGGSMATPFGDISVPNITPDKDTGIGSWTDDDFYRAFHEGIGKQGEYLYPVFPFPWFTKVTKADALAIKAYLFSLQPVHSERPPLKLVFPTNIRTSLLAWRTVFFTPGEFKPDPNKSAAVNRGAYLVEGLGHCGECHNKNNIAGVSRWSGSLQGGEILGWYAPNITSDGHEGVGRWSTAEITKYLKTGASPHVGVTLGPMKETINDSLRYLNDSDLLAMAAYLKSFPAKETFKPVAPSDFQQRNPPGVVAYVTHCASCHGQNGAGIKGQIPALAGNGAVLGKGPQNVLQVIVRGLPAQHGQAPMPAVGAVMTDQQVADAANYVRNSWGNTAPATAGGGDVAKLRTGEKTFMQGDAKACSAINSAAQQALRKQGIDTVISDASPADMLQKITQVLPKLKAATPGLTSDDRVDTLTALYCQSPAIQQLPEAQRATRIGDFASLTYSEFYMHGSGVRS